MRKIVTRISIHGPFSDIGDVIRKAIEALVSTVNKAVKDEESAQTQLYRSLRVRPRRETQADSAVRNLRNYDSGKGLP
jgi:hypothetical protein